MAGFLEGLGAALTTGSSLAGRARAERRQSELDKQQREMELARMALERQRFDMTAKGFEADEQDRLESRASRALERLGPAGTADAQTAAIIERGGLGGVLAPEQAGTLDSEQFVPDMFGETGIAQQESPGLQAGRAVIPNAAQKAQLEQFSIAKMQAETQRRANQAISDPRFEAMPQKRQAVIWQQAGLDGQVPLDEKILQDRARFDADLELRNARVIEGIRAEAARFRGAGQRKFAPLGMINELTQINDALRQTMPDGELAQLAKSAGATGAFSGLQASVPPGVTSALGMSSEPRQRRALIDLSRQIIGKGLEGGVLRKEDEEKYKDILPTMYDPPELVTSKVANIFNRISVKREEYISNAEAGGYDMSKFRMNATDHKPAASHGRVDGGQPTPSRARVVARRLVTQGQ